METLSRLVNAIQGPCVLAVDAPWGDGKTTFIKIWSQHLRNQGFTVVEFNAWETDFFQDPFVALCTELIGSIDAVEGNEMSSKIDEVKKRGQVVFRHLASNAVERMTFGLMDYNTLKVDLEKQSEDSQIQQRMDEYKEMQEALKLFRQALQDMAEELAGPGPLVVMIDELDRCRPSYAIELLETTKHLFAVDQVVFVLAVNRTELQHVIRALYGNDFNAGGYLRRFFDIDFRLPKPNRSKYIIKLLNVANIKEKPVRDTLNCFFDAAPISLRDVAQAIHRLGLVLKSLPDNSTGNRLWSGIILIMRTLNEENYYQFVHGEIHDEEFAEETFKSREIAPLRWEIEGVIFQAGIIEAYKDLSGKHNTTTPLEDKLTRHLRPNKSETGRILCSAWDQATDYLRGGFMVVHRHIEFLSSSLTIHRGIL